MADATNADLIPAIAARLGWDGMHARDDVTMPRQFGPSGPLDGIRGVVVVLVDGLGWQQLLADGVDAPMMRAAARDQQPLRSELPSTTATNIVSLGTGRRSGDHGILGYTMVLDQGGTPAVFNPLVWRYGLRGGGRDARAAVVPEALVPGPTMLERLAAGGVTVTAVVRPEFLDSGLTRAGLRGGQRVAASGLEESLGVALASVGSGHGPALAYCHHPTVDALGHLHGPHTPAWAAAVRDVDDAVAAVVADLRSDLAIVVVADHGMVAISRDDVVDLAAGHRLLDGVALVAGEPRMRTLVLEPDAPVDRVVAAWRDHLGDRATVLTTTEAIALGWFGAVVPEGHARRLGDVVVASRVGAVTHPRVDPRGGRMAGMHGSITDAEVLVPALVLTRP